LKLRGVLDLKIITPLFPGEGNQDGTVPTATDIEFSEIQWP
jgi:hypothetical protein